MGHEHEHHQHEIQVLKIEAACGDDAPISLKFSVPAHVFVLFEKIINNTGQSGDVLQLLKDIKQQGIKIMSALEDANAALTKIDDATNKMGATLQAEGDTLQKISDEIDAFIAGNPAGGTITPEFLASLQAKADALQGVSDTQDKLAIVAAAIAAKGTANPVPVPVPAPTPIP